MSGPKPKIGFRWSPGTIVVCTSGTDDGTGDGMLLYGEQYVVDNHNPESGFVTVKTSVGLRTYFDDRFKQLNAPVKFDDNKPRMDLVLGIRGIEHVGQVFTHGAKKYGDLNWRKGGNDLAFKGRMLAACLRHLIKHARGVKIDEESGLPHVAHAISNLLMILDLENE